PIEAAHTCPRYIAGSACGKTPSDPFLDEIQGRCMLAQSMANTATERTVMLRSQVLVLILALSGVASQAEGALRTFYVDPAGNDGAAGSTTAPWLTLQHAANTVQAGDLVIVRAGHYAGFDIRTSGTSVYPIEFRAEPGVVVDTPNPVTPNH